MNKNLQIFHIFFISDIKSLTGEPDYRSVNLTWEIEEFENEVDGGSQEEITLDDEMSDDTRSFTVYYCELQTWGAHRCKSKVLEDREPREGFVFSTFYNKLKISFKNFL